MTLKMKKNIATCSGWAMMMLAKDRPDFRVAPWPFSYEGEGEP